MLELLFTHNFSYYSTAAFRIESAFSATENCTTTSIQRESDFATRKLQQLSDLKEGCFATGKSVCTHKCLSAFSSFSGAYNPPRSRVLFGATDY